MWTWLVREWQWPAAVLFTAPFLLLFLPLWSAAPGLGLMLVYLQLPLYMLHQGEEHLGDRFRLFINREVAGGREALTPTATFWINALGVWGVDLGALYLAWGVRPALGLIAGYLAVVNALVHLVPVVVKRAYNPGVWTALVLLLPFGGWCVHEVALWASAIWLDHLVGLGVALGVHALIVAHVLRRIRQMPMPAHVSPSEPIPL